MRIAYDQHNQSSLTAPAAIETSNTARFRRAKRLALPAFLLLIYVLQCVWFARTQSFVYDEPLHISTGLDAWRYRRFDLVLEHPPLGHLLPTLPIAFGKWDI